jgi:hypothetical protein
MKVWKLSAVVLALILLIGAALPALAQDGAPINPGGPFVPPNANNNGSALMTFADVEKALFGLEARSKGVMTLDIVGTTLENRPLYIAKLGHGPQRMWIQGRIHGNEPLGNDVCIEIIKSLLSSDKKLMDEMTFWIIPMYNPDGAEHFWRWNATGSAPRSRDRVDLNRNWYRTLEDGWPPSYSEPESRAFYAAWAEFQPDYAIDLHHQGTYFVEGTNEMTTFSIGIPVAESALDPWVWDTNRRMAVVGYDAVKKLGFVNPSRYPDIDIRNAVVSSMMLDNPGPDGSTTGHKTAAMFFENRGGIGNRSRGYIIQQNVVATHAIINAIASETLDDVDPNRWSEIPFRPIPIDDDDKWPNRPD